MQLDTLWNFMQVDMQADKFEGQMRQSPNRQKLVKARDFLKDQQANMKKLENDVAAMQDRLEAVEDEAARLEKVLDGLNPVITARNPVEFRCNCGKERYERALVLLGHEEVQKIVDDGEPIEIKCQFCGKTYRFSQEELQAVLKKTEKKA